MIIWHYDWLSIEESLIQDLRESIALRGHRTTNLSYVVLLEGLYLVPCHLPSVVFGAVDGLVRRFVFVKLLVLLLVVLLRLWCSLHEDFG